MKPIVGHAIVSCYVDAASLLVMVLLLLLSERIRSRKTESLRIYHLLCLVVTVTCVNCFVFNAMYGQPAPWCHTVALISRSLWEFYVLGTVCLWLAYVDTMLYGKQEKWTLLRIIRITPVSVFVVLLIINPFTGIIFTIAEDNSLQPKLLFYLMMATNFLLFLSSAVAVWHYDRKNSKVRFLRLTPMIISVFVALLPQFFSPYSTGIMGYAIGMLLFYFSMITEIQFIDEESGLYNRGYLTYLFDMALAGKDSTHSALILEADGNMPACFEILTNVLHQNGDVVRVEDKKFMMFSRIDSRSTMGYISSLVDEAVEKHNKEHPDEKVKISQRCSMRTGGQDSFAFLSSIMEDKDAGDEMRGIVSMISELDRLDKELELAADIQVSVLPTSFPAFPNRTEFDLYASMTPAKEVGGDFYDFFLIDDDHLALVIADVSGKGIPSSLFMMTSKALIKNQLMDGCTPAEALERMNNQLCEHNSSMMFVTVWLAVAELSPGKGVAVNAGHENPALRRTGGNFQLLRYKHGIFAGVNKNVKYEEREFYLYPGDCIFVYTDGVPEANNEAAEMFGEERMVAALNKDPDATPEELIHSMRDAVDQFAAGADQFDDITMLCMKYYGTKGKKEKG